MDVPRYLLEYEWDRRKAYSKVRSQVAITNCKYIQVLYKVILFMETLEVDLICSTIYIRASNLNTYQVHVILHAVPAILYSTNLSF